MHQPPGRSFDGNDTVDLLFTDILMPGEMNGRELANWATKKYPRLKVLLTTASEEEASIEQPVSSQRFPAVVKTLQQKRTH
jgi:CheY-like chemotaxis protein